MINKELREYIAEINEMAVLFDNPSFDNSIVGLSSTDCVVYDLDKMIEEFARENDVTEEEAMEFIDYNTLRAIPYCHEQYAPIVLTSTDIVGDFVNG